MPKNPDGTVGFRLDGKAQDFWDWVEFFDANGMPARAAYCRKKAAEGGYFIAASPMHVDASFVPLDRARPRSEPISAERREELARRIRAMFPAIPRRERGRYAQDDARAQVPQPPEMRPLTEAEIASMQRMLGERGGA